jgi:hypothetical protein
MLRHIIPAAVLFFVSAGLIGCGAAPRYPVEGTAQLNNEPVDGGKIIFLPMGDGEGSKRVSATGDIQGGKFALTAGNGPNAGKYKVEIYWFKKTGKQVDNDGKKVDETLQVVPAKYNDQTSETVEISSGMLPLSFDIKGSPPPKSTAKKKGD